jgi:hypothetical protein
VTADVVDASHLSEHVGQRTCSRILEMCDHIPFFDGDHRVKATKPVDVGLAG